MTHDRRSASGPVRFAITMMVMITLGARPASGQRTTAHRPRPRPRVPAAAIAAPMRVPAPTAPTVTLASVEYGDWTDTVAALQRDVAAQGRSIGVFAAAPDGSRVLCGRYLLVPGSVAREAFVLGTCDRTNQTTPLRLLHRDALFGHTGLVPVPIPAEVTVLVVPAQAGVVDLAPCSAEVRPSLEDMEHGSRVALTPARFELRVQGDATVEANSDHWVVRMEPFTDRHPVAEFEAVDRVTGQVALASSVSLVCPRTAVEARPEAPLAVASAPVQPVVSRGGGYTRLTDSIVDVGIESSRRAQARVGSAETVMLAGKVIAGGGLAGGLIFAGYVFIQTGFRSEISRSFALGSIGVGLGIAASGGIMWAIGRGLRSQWQSRARASSRLPTFGIGPSGNGTGAEFAATFLF